jgi:hypothetical protein
MIDRLGGREGIQAIVDELVAFLRADEVLAPLVTGEAYNRLRSHVELTLIGSPANTDIFNAITGAFNGLEDAEAPKNRHGEMVVAFDGILNGDMRSLARLLKSLSDDDLLQLTSAGNVIASGGELVMMMRARMRGVL